MVYDGHGTEYLYQAEVVVTAHETSLGYEAFAHVFLDGRIVFEAFNQSVGAIDALIVLLPHGGKRCHFGCGTEVFEVINLWLVAVAASAFRGIVGHNVADGPVKKLNIFHPTGRIVDTDQCTIGGLFAGEERMLVDARHVGVQKAFARGEAKECKREHVG